MSHRSRGAWIEIDSYHPAKMDRYSRIAHAVRGLKLMGVAPGQLSDDVASLTRCVD